MNIAQIENNLQQLVKSFNKETFIYDLLLAYGQPKASIKRLQQGGLNLSKVDGEIAWKKKLLFKVAQNQDVHELIEDTKADVKAIKHDPRFIIVTDFETLLAIDRKTLDTLDIPVLELAGHFDFFLPLAGMEKAQQKIENPADVKAAERMAKLFDEIKKDNPTNTPEEIHNLNVFLSRLLFCFFAEDTSIFVKGQFTNAIKSHTQEDGSDLSAYLSRLFKALNTPDSERKNLPAYLSAFPYVNGGLFREQIQIPQFARRSRQAIIESGDLDWSAINPDIFGSMFQAVVAPDLRGNLGMHYTSVPNIMKVIEPLFLNELYKEFEKVRGNGKKLNQLLSRIKKIKIFDPACGSGNFLIIAYKELRRLEMKIFEGSQTLALSGISISQFYGIEIDDFAHEIAILSLWLTEHQMNVEFFKKFGQCNPTLPLKEAGNIVCGNATRVDWGKVCPKNDGDEIYILGNPPYLGFNLQNENQRSDMQLVFATREGYKRLDYICCWFQLGAKYILSSNAKLAFVSTNSICQGEQVALLWPHIFQQGLEIGFAHQSFKWTNNAKGNAGVTCIIVGLRDKEDANAIIYNNNIAKIVKKINAYLTAGSEVIVAKRGTPLSEFPDMLRGDMPIDGGYLILDRAEKESLINDYPDAKLLIREFVGADEFLKGDIRWCFWITNDALNIARPIPPIMHRLEQVRKMRLASKNKSTQELAQTPHLFGQIRHLEEPSIIIPSTTSERRKYVPIGFINSRTIISNLAYSIPSQEPSLFGILSSVMHTTWVRAVAGGLETRIRYTSGLCYNTFPFPNISKAQKDTLERLVFRLLSEREKHSEKTLAQLYDPDKMPDGLREAHHQLDLAVDRCYRSKPFESDEARLEYLFKLYEQMIAEEKK